MKKIYIKTLGCQMNVRDSEVICGLLRSAGYKFTDDSEKADIVIFNTCSVRQHAEDKVWSEIGRFKRGSPGYQVTRSPIVGVVGCMAQNYKEAIFNRAPQVDFVVGPSDIHKIPDIIKRFTTSNLFESKIWETDGSIRPQEIYHTGFYEDKNHAYVVISEGCSNYCSYCVVPYVRGQLHNRDYKDILKEIEQALDNGITRITLLGQNVNAYKSPSSAKNFGGPANSCGGHQVTKSPVNFIELLRLINNLAGLKEFSFITSHPKDTTIDLFKAMADLEKLKKHLHLPVQSGSDRILKLMNRGYSRKFYLDLVDNYRKIVKYGFLTTDIIVGFPSETKEDFQASRSLVEEVAFGAAYIFKYSTRPHTEAAKLADELPLQEKERRHRIILELQKEISGKLKAKSEKLKAKSEKL